MEPPSLPSHAIRSKALISAIDGMTYSSAPKLNDEAPSYSQAIKAALREDSKSIIESNNLSETNLTDLSLSMNPTWNLPTIKDSRSDWRILTLYTNLASDNQDEADSGPIKLKIKLVPGDSRLHVLPPDMRTTAQTRTERGKVRSQTISDLARGTLKWLPSLNGFPNEGGSAILRAGYLKHLDEILEMSGVLRSDKHSVMCDRVTLDPVTFSPFPNSDGEGIEGYEVDFTPSWVSDVDKSYDLKDISFAMSSASEDVLNDITGNGEVTSPKLFDDGTQEGSSDESDSPGGPLPKRVKVVDEDQ
jgi:hypothetical protein